MELTQKQTQAIQSKAKNKVLNFGRRAGKTTELAYEALGTTLSIDNAKVTYYAQTFGDARDIAWDIFLEIFKGAIVKKNETLLEVILKNIKGGISKVSFKGWESVVNSEKGRGTENHLLLLDEVAYLRGFNYHWERVLEPTLLTTKGRVVFSSTPNGFNDFYELSNKAQNTKDWFYIHATSYDNPFNSKEWLDEKKNSLLEDTFAQEYLAEFRKQEGLVFKEFLRSAHIYDKIGESTVISNIGGVDFGFTNPTAIIQVQKDKKGVFWVKEKYYETQKTDAQVADVVSAMDFQKVYPDPENAAGIQELKNRNVNVYDVLKGKGSIVSGINKIRELLKQGRLKIHKSSINLIWEFETYHYPLKKDEGDEKELPVHENCHLIDALRYIILMEAKTHEIHRYDKWLHNLRKRSEKKVNPAY